AGDGARGRAGEGPQRASIDSRSVRPGDLFIGLPGERTDGGAHAPQALAGGAWGVLVSPAHAQAALASAAGALVLEHDAPLAAMQALARAWRRALGGGEASVIAITGSTGKTSTKDILVALLRRARRTSSSPENLNTEIGLPLAVLAAPADTQALVLEMAMRGAGQIAELTAIAEPDVGVIVNVGPAHLELLGSLEAIAAAKAELIAGLAAGASVVLPARERLLDAHLRSDLRTITFGEGGDVTLLERRAGGEVVIGTDRRSAGARELVLAPTFGQPHQLQNLLAAIAAARAIGVEPDGRVEVAFSALRGERVVLPAGAVVINDCYNANPMSMRAAIDELAEVAPARRVAVLGDMLELGESSPRLHREIGRHATQRGVDVLIAVGPLAEQIGETFGGELHAVPDADAAATTLATLLRPDDTVLVKGSRGVALERVAQALSREGSARRTPAGGRAR
ncbi:MAG TPA: UDP-N-acetylmuramoyl-tripeptide--D-alanyl-D-alanine ligase, partial [Solirubrobacteraceae bacterium]|nr:UDP-N-acetylmuramoyl-tripeptide--D-alanyl-D-alanine ligase [Solirubrobacteraceae bacterium]